MGYYKIFVSLLSILIILIMSFPQPVMTQPITNSNTLSTKTNEDIFDILKNATSLSLTYFPHNAESGDKILVTGYLTSNSLRTGAPALPSPLSLPNPDSKPVSGANILIILGNATDNKMINTTTATTDKFGTFSIPMKLPSLNTSQFSLYSPLPIFLIVGSFDGNEKNYPTYQIKTVNPSPPNPCPPGKEFIPFTGQCSQSSTSDNQKNSTNNIIWYEKIQNDNRSNPSPFLSIDLTQGIVIILEVSVGNDYTIQFTEGYQAAGFQHNCI